MEYHREVYEFFVYDLETTGLDPEKDEILSICISHIIENTWTENNHDNIFIMEEESRETIYVRPDMDFDDISKEALNINKITKKEIEIRQSRPWKEVFKYLVHWIDFHTRSGRIPLLIGFNNHIFDDLFLIEATKKMNYTFPYKVYTGDLFSLVKKRNIKGNDRTVKLYSLAETFLPDHLFRTFTFHRVNDDVTATTKLFTHPESGLKIDIKDSSFLIDLELMDLIELENKSKVKNDAMEIMLNKSERKQEGDEIDNKINEIKENTYLIISEGKRFHKNNQCIYLQKSKKEKIKISKKDIHQLDIQPCPECFPYNDDNHEIQYKKLRSGIIWAWK